MTESVCGVPCESAGPATAAATMAPLAKSAIERVIVFPSNGLKLLERILQVANGGGSRLASGLAYRRRPACCRTARGRPWATWPRRRYVARLHLRGSGPASLKAANGKRSLGANVSRSFAPAALSPEKKGKSGPTSGFENPYKLRFSYRADGFGS